MATLTGAERIFTTLQLKEPDRVPIYEGPNRNIREKVLGPDATAFDAIEHFDLDGVGMDDRSTPAWHGENLDASGIYFKNQWGTVNRVTSESLPHPVEGAVKSEKDLDTWQLPDPDDPRCYQFLKEIIKRYKGQRAIIASFQDPFNVANEVRGATNHYMDFVRNPDLVDRLSGLIRDYYLRYITNCVEAGADIIHITGDYATTKWPMLSREHFARHVIPVLKSLIDHARSLGVYATKHTDGNIMPIIDQIIDAGIQGLHPIDPVAGMDLGEVKKQYGDRICLIGNVNCAYTLTWGSLEEVREEVKRCIRQAAPGGGYILMSSNSIHSAVKPENYVEMVRACREYGNYPVSA